MIFVITWSDGERNGVVRAYADPDRAKADMEMLREQSNRDFDLHEVSYLDD